MLISMVDSPTRRSKAGARSMITNAQSRILLQKENSRGRAGKRAANDSPRRSAPGSGPASGLDETAGGSGCSKVIWRFITGSPRATQIVLRPLTPLVGVV